MFIVSNAADLLSFRICTSMLLLQWDTIYIDIRKLLTVLNQQCCCFFTIFRWVWHTPDTVFYHRKTVLLIIIDNQGMRLKSHAPRIALKVCLHSVLAFLYLCLSPLLTFCANLDGLPK